MQSGRKCSLWKWAALTVVLLSLFAAARLLPVDQWLKAFNEWVSHLGPWGIVIFIGAYVLASWIGMLPGTLLYVYLGAAGKAGLQVATGADAGRSALEWTFLAVGLAATIAVTIWVTKIARNALRNKDVT